ncbi:MULTISPECIES: flagellar assembly peptidoglycan hydrolase FlgJ [unclassified Halomonas]|uniref:flagellar assembly peptidoglycan hydrolase FlgJ n=1 Tax=unclassified Halomonas TaxID=2609666 RepID=UPI002884177E|nr:MULTISPECIES: flagellar assembly peptidoglycan hydrolase FlgJ [unclassified Halomonas]MDT0500514.1 flagellar assembly peptidoglycan hydrolase FlgJ [Halomonas sp. PAR7]MDT0511590.1 flagellar assembly peptidoglycan hydrolase FlgJ [Halomonas sp. LES1]MDT0590122.1 flagellar assembly peptidoglycan hydrolase FlgJ [Halomonas sp. PAR8]
MALSHGNGLDGQFALEMQGLQRLKHSARQDPASGADAAAQQFEALFIQMMVKSMRDAVPTTGLLDNKQSEFFQSMLDQQWSQTMASRGIGLADKLVSELESRGLVPSQAAPAENALIAGIPRGTPRPLRDAIQSLPSSAVEPGESQAVPDNSVSGFMAALDARPRGAAADSGGDMATQQAAGLPASRERSAMPAHVRTFLDRLEAPAQAASRATGVPAELILAQAALETGWGRHEISTRDGGNSHNLFGIKAGSSWRGETTEIVTHEVYGGQRQRVRDDFRVYASFEEAFTDYANLIGNNPRYRAVTAAASPAEAAHALQQGGYATDPAYADKLIAVMHSIGPLGTDRQLASAGSIAAAGLR